MPPNRANHTANTTIPPSTRLPRTPIPRSGPPVVANFPSAHLVVGCGVAIFHVASARVVLCWHSRDRYWFLPKGRRDAGEETARAAEREGFEESGYRNRLLPLPIPHRQPSPAGTARARAPYSTEPVWTQLVPASAHTQYILFWYVAETVPPNDDDDDDDDDDDTTTTTTTTAPYTPPLPYPPTLRLRDRIAQEEAAAAAGRRGGRRAPYEPRRHEGTGVNEEEALYESHLVPVREAVRKLEGHVMGDVVRIGWEGIVERLAMEGRAEGEGEEELE